MSCAKVLQYTCTFLLKHSEVSLVVNDGNHYQKMHFLDFLCHVKYRIRLSTLTKDMSFRMKFITVQISFCQQENVTTNVIVKNRWILNRSLIRSNVLEFTSNSDHYWELIMQNMRCDFTRHYLKCVIPNLIRMTPQRCSEYF